MAPFQTAQSSAPAAAPVVDLQDVVVNLASAAGTVNVLRGLNLTADPGERLGVVGPSGSGKTTMLMVMAGLERATSGRIVVAGEDLAPMSEDQLANFRLRRLGIVFQSFHLIPTMTALENVAMPLEFAADADAFDRAAQALEQVGLGHRLTHYPGQMSGGEQQRVAVARAFVGEPDLLLADEPTGNLDRATANGVFDLMLQLARDQGTAFVLVTHDEALAARCNRQLRLVGGVLQG